MKKILISDSIGQSGIEFLKGKGLDVVYMPDITEEQLLSEIGNYDGVIVRSRTKVTAEIIAAGKNLKVIGRAGSGLDTIDVEAAKKAGVRVVNAAGANSQSVAEHTMALILALFRNLIPVASALKNGTWEKKTYKAVDLAGKTIGIVGFGSIGSKVAVVARGFGMKILVTTRSETPEKKQLLDAVGGAFVPLEKLLKDADIVTLHVPKSGETVAMIGAKELASMKKTAFLINCSRGGVVDEKALIDALQKGIISGAGLDVFSVEPLPQDSDLLSLSNVILTPHIAASSVESRERASLAVAQEVAKLL